MLDTDISKWTDEQVKNVLSQIGYAIAARE